MIDVISSLPTTYLPFPGYFEANPNCNYQLICKYFSVDIMNLICFIQPTKMLK